MTRSCVWWCAALLLVISGPACKKVVQLGLNSVAPQIVIQGNITDKMGPYHVQISQSVDFSANNTNPPVSGATVRITDSTTGFTELLKEVDSGVYATSQLQGHYRHTYNLLVTVNGRQYASSSTMPEPVRFDSISFEENEDFNGQKVINAIVNFQDPPGVANYYQFIEVVDGRLIPDIFVFDDRLSDGRYIEEPLFNDSSYLQHKSSLILTMNCIDPNVYNYFYTLSNVTANTGFQSTTPANPATNITNGGLGYFSAHTTTSEQIFVY